MSRDDADMRTMGFRNEGDVREYNDSNCSGAHKAKATSRDAEVADYKDMDELLRQIDIELKDVAYTGSYVEGIKTLKKQLSDHVKREVMLRQELLHYGEHEGSCSIVDLDADGLHCECNCGLSAILAATEPK